VNGNAFVEPLDALVVINFLNESSQSSEGEATVVHVEPVVAEQAMNDLPGTIRVDSPLRDENESARSSTHLFTLATVVRADTEARMHETPRREHSHSCSKCEIELAEAIDAFFKDYRLFRPVMLHGSD
jgi:hypothetical protein